MMLSRSFEEKRFIHVETIDLIGFCISFGVFFSARMCIIYGLELFPYPYLGISPE